MPLFIVTMKQVIEHEYRVEAFDEPEAIVLAHEADAKDGGEKWYNLGYDGDVCHASLPQRKRVPQRVRVKLNRRCLKRLSLGKAWWRCDYVRRCILPIA